jgi:hypothetical protein
LIRSELLCCTALVNGNNRNDISIPPFASHCEVNLSRWVQVTLLLESLKFVVTLSLGVVIMVPCVKQGFIACRPPPPRDCALRTARSGHQCYHWSTLAHIRMEDLWAHFIDAFESGEEGVPVILCYLTSHRFSFKTLPAPSLL